MHACYHSTYICNLCRCTRVETSISRGNDHKWSDRHNSSTIENEWTKRTCSPNCKTMHMTATSIRRVLSHWKGHQNQQIRWQEPIILTVYPCKALNPCENWITSQYWEQVDKSVMQTVCYIEAGTQTSRRRQTPNWINQGNEGIRKSSMAARVQ